MSEREEALLEQPKIDTSHIPDERIREALYALTKYALPERAYIDLDSDERYALQRSCNVGKHKHTYRWNDLSSAEWNIQEDTLDLRFYNEKNYSQQHSLTVSLAKCLACARGLYEVFLPEATEIAHAKATQAWLKMLTIEELRKAGILPG